MWLSISLPTLDTDHAVGTLRKQHAKIGERLERGSVLADVVVDLSAGSRRDCPPLTTCRIIMQETAWLREVLITPKKLMKAGETIALLSVERDTVVEAPRRRARTTVVAILDQQDWWVNP